MKKPKPRRRRNAKPIGRPRKDIDLKLLRTLSAAACSIEEIAAMLRNSGCQLGTKTLKRRLQEAAYREARDEGVNVGKAKLRSNMVELSHLKNSAGVQMSIHLSKHWLGMTDKSALELTGKNGGPIQTVDLSKASDEQLSALEAIFGPLAVASRDDGGDQGGADQAGAAAGA